MIGIRFEMNVGEKNDKSSFTVIKGYSFASVIDPKYYHMQMFL